MAASSNHKTYLYCFSALAVLIASAASAADYTDPMSAAKLATSPTNPTPNAPKHYSLESLFGNSANAPAPGSFAAAIMNGTPWIEERYRYEDDSQDGIHRHAKASTLRSRVGYETGSFDGFKVGFEVQNVKDIGAEHFNNGINGKTLYPQVTDPEDTALRQGYIAYDGLYNSEIKAGRQLINLDNQRWVGQSDWRQLGNNFDAVSFYNTYFKNTELFYAYVRQANRGYGDNSPLGTLIGNSHLIHAAYTVAPELKITGYSYLLDFETNNPSLSIFSTQTYGLRFTGEHKINDNFKLFYALEGANQQDYENNPLHANNNYYLIEPGASAFGFTTKLGYEMMEGDGTSSIQTPINTNHSFDGWADKFTTVPTRGLLNQYAMLQYKVPFGNEWVKGTEITGYYRKFNSDAQDLNYGHEWDGLISKTFFEHYSANLEVADYRASNTAYTNTYKVFAFFGLKF